MFYIIFNSWEPTFWGAFLGAFFSFWFYILGYYLPKGVTKISLRLKTKKKMNELYRLLLLNRDSKSIFFDLIEIFNSESMTKSMGEILKGHILTSGERLQFESESWEIIIISRLAQARFILRNFNSQYSLGFPSNKEENLGVLLDFIQYLELRCKQENLTLRISEEVKKAKNTLRRLSLEEHKKNPSPQ